ncbi:type VI secretion system accessory protein TagJ [Rhodovulum sp. DZ06]|uniref:type VI secretion system accessory protein TagJ n=1 Tax=Rhodovulum sp. DZ06 TaxID=3425126 RepID=UPI003D33BAC8
MSKTASAAEEALKQGDLKGCREALFKHVRSKPEDAAARAFLFQFLCLTGEWDRAKKQLQLFAEMDATAIGFAAIYSAGIDAMVARADVIAGKTLPPVFGPPEAWIAKLGEALRQDAADPALATSLRQDAYAEAPTRKGTVDGKPFDWITDADARFGPALEAVVDGAYHWLPFQHIAKLELEAPRDLRDLVWMEGALTLTNGGSFGILVPARYPGAETSGDAAEVMARKTDWEEMGEGMYRGRGQKMLATDQDDLSLLDVRVIEFEAPEVEMNFDAGGADLSAEMKLSSDPSSDTSSGA